MPSRPASIQVRALQWLAQREYSRSELRDKLLRLLQRHNAAQLAAAVDTPVEAIAPSAEAAATDVDSLLQWLEQRGYLSEQRFVESRVRVRAARYGNLRIQHELQQHGLTLAPEAQQALRQTELQRASEVWRKKYGAPAADAAGRMRQMRFLAGRGFSADVVRRVLKDAGAVEGSPAPDPECDAPD